MPALVIFVLFAQLLLHTFDLLPLGADRNPRPHFFFFSFFIKLISPKQDTDKTRKRRQKALLFFSFFFFSFSVPSNFELVCSRKYNYPGWSENTAGLNIAMGICVSSGAWVGLVNFILLYQQILPKDIQTNEVSEDFFSFWGSLPWLIFIIIFYYYFFYVEIQVLICETAFF